VPRYLRPAPHPTCPKSPLLAGQMWVNRHLLIKTSSTPGKTQLINHFKINGNWFLVDLPGYGYAKVPIAQKIKWEKMTWEYILNRTNLLYLFVLLDMRLSPQAKDIDFIRKLGEKGIPIKLIFTKSDKVKPMEGQKNINDFREELAKEWAIIPEFFVSSSEKRKGKVEILGLISEILEANA
jgi:GTP-binding protein